MDELDRDTFNFWMKKIWARFDETDEKIKRLATQNALEDIKLLDNQDLCLMLHINTRTLQRYRKEGVIKYFNIKGKNYYRVSDVREYIKNIIPEQEKS